LTTKQWGQIKGKWVFCARQRKRNDGTRLDLAALKKEQENGNNLFSLLDLVQ